MQIATRRIDTTSPRRPIAAGIAVGALGIALTALQVGTDGAAPWQVTCSATLMGIGSKMVLIPTMTTASRDLPKDRMAAASTALSINSQVSASAGTALISVVLDSAGTDPAGFQITYAVATAVLALALLPASLLPRRRPGT